MEITGRLTGDATVKTLRGERKVVNFSIAINDSYRSGGEQKKITTFFECSYWLNTGIAEYLKKGGWVQLYGRVGANAYINGKGEAKASLTFHTSEVKLLGSTGSSGKAAVSTGRNRSEGTQRRKKRS
ncbi:single-stranded DNA-binding protein [Pedobacter sp. R-06]|uniref:single-stranded DNA-binding protein n=1 Tax=Pedobacter sp. R-06 TaxID=3404051 RepID=UPI003CEAD1DA